MAAGSVARIGAVGRRGIGAARRRFAATTGDAAPRRLAKAEEKVEEEWTSNQLWLKSQLTELSSSSSKELHSLRREVSRMEDELSAARAKYSMIEAKRSAVEMSCEIVLGMGFLTLVAMLLLH
ncbi:uncharacterized protein LOC120661941 isoform X2 [Panicum virgatum]|uniref:uncharacterized protein LOC120661941 isoform X2 n=1 Tax=Panicum virgatum TaxID=38727 RepID=UPI0019D5DE17|nr:uncharacterized protein LOC120661941 isoform X2 [Panicum virgatum]